MGWPELILDWCGSAPLGTLGDVWGHFWFSQLGREELPAPGGWRPRLLLSTLQCTGRPTPEKDPPVPRWWCGSVAFVPVCFCLWGLKLTQGLIHLPLSCVIFLFLSFSCPGFQPQLLSSFGFLCQGPPNYFPKHSEEARPGQKQPDILFPIPAAA